MISIHCHLELMYVQNNIELSVYQNITVTRREKHTLNPLHAHLLKCRTSRAVNSASYIYLQRKLYGSHDKNRLVRAS